MKRCSKCGTPLLWYEVTEGICFNCKSKITGIDKNVLLQGVRGIEKKNR